MSRSGTVSFDIFVASAKAEAEELLTSFTVLNLAPFNGKLELSGLGLLDDYEIVQTLKSEMCKNIKSVNLSGHPESIFSNKANPMIMLLSDYLPNLKYICIRDVDLSPIDKFYNLSIETQMISDFELCKLYAKGIYIEGTDDLMKAIKNKLINFLRSNGQSTYGEQLERPGGFMPDTLVPARFQKALDFFNKLASKQYEKFEKDAAERDKKSLEAMRAIQSRDNQVPISNNNQTSNEIKDPEKIKHKK